MLPPYELEARSMQRRLSFYWSSTTYQHLPDFAWFVLFHAGIVTGGIKTGFYYIRA